MIKVLIVPGKLYIGGAERVCRDIGYYSDPAQFQIDYLVFGDDIGAYEPELIEKGCRIWHFPSPDNGYSDFYRNLKKLILNERYHVVHCHTMFNSGIVLHAARRCGVRIRIAHSHSIQESSRRRLIQSVYEKTMRRLILHDATSCVGCGQAAGEWLFGRKPFQKKGILLLNGIELEDFRFNSSIREQIRRDHHWTDKYVIGHVGHLAPVKNQTRLVRLMPEILKTKENAILLLLGDGPDRSKLEGIIHELRLENSVILLGNVDNVNEYLSAMDVFAFPSLHEGTPLAVLEAQANGLPCVLSDRIPKDVQLTGLIRVLSLNDTDAAWGTTLTNVDRAQSDPIIDTLRSKGIDKDNMLRTIYQIYRGELQ